jgi:lactoylglutathione lyase
MIPKLLIYSDGGARGNPGPSAIAFIAINEAGVTMKADSSYIGVHTNNQAEYKALLMALKFAVDQKAQEVICHLDSELVGKQLNGQYAVKNSGLQPLNLEVKNLLGCFKKIQFVNVKREHPQIQRADELVNKTLDEAAKRGYPKIADSSCSKAPIGAGSLFIHASIRTSNLERSIDFYSRFLDMKIKSRLELKRTGAKIVFLQDAQGKGSTLELTFYSNQTKFTQADFENRLFDHLGFEIQDIHRTIGAMKKENVVVTDEPFMLDANTILAFVEDPDGTRIELIEHRQPYS